MLARLRRRDSLTVAAHVVLGFSWMTAGLIGAALAPTDPAVTFSVLGDKEVKGRAGTILEGESGFNDPVGIALMIGMVEMATAGGSFWVVVKEFVIEMGVGLALGLLGGFGLVWAMRRLQLPERPGARVGARACRPPVRTDRGASRLWVPGGVHRRSPRW